MLVVAQFPIADLRPFLPASDKRTRPRDWPPRARVPNQFVHAFGPAVVRERGADWAWLDERVYCRADRALRFPLLPVELGGWKENIRCAFRRLLSDGEAVARVEVGLSWIPEYEETLLWRNWDKDVKQHSDPTRGLQNTQFDINPLEVIRYVASIPTTVHPMNGTSVSRPLILQGRALSELYWRATSNNKTPGSASRVVLHGAPLLLIECRSPWIEKLPKNFAPVNPASAANVKLAFGRVQTQWGPLGVWVLGHELAKETESRNLRLCLLRLHAEQEVLDAILGQLSDGVLEYDASESVGRRLETYLNEASRRIYKRRRGGIDQSAVLAAFDAADATEYRAVRMQLAERLKGAHRQVVRKLELFERRNYVRAERFINVEPGGTYAEKVEHMTNKTINIGNGSTINAPVVIADRIQDSFNVLEKSNANPEVKALISDLLKQVTQTATTIKPEKAKEMASDAETLVKEIAKEAPRRKWYELSIEGLRAAAEAVGDVGQPILKTTAKLLPLLRTFFP